MIFYWYFLYFSLVIEFAVSTHSGNFGEADCSLSHTQKGPHCMAGFVRFYYDQGAGRCKQTNYGGCRSTNNNFEFLEECQTIAEPVCKGTATTPADPEPAKKQF